MEDIPRSWIARINIVKMSILPKAIYKLNTIPVKVPAAFFTEIEERILKFIWNNKRPRIAKAILRKKNKVGGILQSYSNQNSMVLAPKQTHRSMEQNWKPRSKTTHLWTANLQQRSQEHTMKKGKSLQKMVLGKLDSHMQKNERRPLPYTKINSKWIKDLNVRPETMKLLEENIGSMLFHTGVSSIFSNSMST